MRLRHLLAARVWWTNGGSGKGAGSMLVVEEVVEDAPNVIDIDEAAWGAWWIR